MKLLRIGVLALAGPALAASSLYDFTLQSIDGVPVPLASFQGRAVLVVNVASRCGYTPQYAGLESLYRKYKDRGLVIIGIPSNNFGGQEPGTNEEIQSFCSRTYQVTFPMMAKINVRGAGQAALYAWLTSKAANSNTAGAVRWNFTKFLVGKDGRPLQRFEPGVYPDSPELALAIEKALR